ncbi:MAG: cyclodeaminase/cyclohydrolase family protein [Candidatus Pristimantibacillus sp.]
MSTISWDHSMREFVQQAASSSPTPGGGSVAALVAALGAAMTSMVGNLSQGAKFAHIQPQITDVIEQMNTLSATCEVLLHDDIASFNKYMEALKLPKNTEEEQSIRKNSLHEAAIHAIDVPLRLIEICKAGLVCTHSIAESSNKNVISDLGIGAILFEAAAQSALLTVEINLVSLKDIELKRQYSHNLYSLMNEIGELKTKVVQVTRTRMMST